ncbi:CoB--CoM heterodisulfide reductase iron-sulfur subunit A family protein, partial [Desulfobulbus sp. F1]|nr:CoB--CoM heterodisulfide reductase iron-sulfur subunit A family protein [Desulfobulbus sp. F1]
MNKVYGAYLCTGCGIGNILDAEGLKNAASETGIEMQEHDCLCGAEGLALINKDIAEKGVNTVVVCACSPRVMQDVFSFGENTITIRGNLREQVAWVAGDAEKGDEFIQELGEDYVRMAVTRAQKSELPKPYLLENISKKILVMGGGIAGLTAASEAAKAGYEVTLVEKTDKLGGKALGWRKMFPTAYPYCQLEQPNIEQLVAAATSNSKITIKTETEVARIGGAPGASKVSFKAADIYGAVVLATGWRPADVSEYEHLGYGKVKNVVTNAEFEKIAKTGKVPAKVAFIQSPGGKDNDRDFPYCNSVTSMVALKQAQYV